MINLRYHIVSLVAVFLALALGVIAGTTVIDKGIVKGLRSARATLVDRNRFLGAQLQQRDRQIAMWNTFGKTLIPEMMRNALKGHEVVEIVEKDERVDIVNAVDQAIEQSGAQLAGRVEFSGKWALKDETSPEQLGLALGITSNDRTTLLRDAGTKLAARMRAPGNPDADGDLLRALQRDGFLTISDKRGGAFPPANTLFVYLSAGNAAGVPDRSAFALQFLRALGARAHVAVGEPLASQESLVDRVRSDGDLRASVATIDHVDTLPGQLALVIALREIAAGMAAPAPAFGVRRGASAVAPTAAPRPSPSASPSPSVAAS
jgi:hypothetical protein